MARALLLMAALALAPAGAEAAPRRAAAPARVDWTRNVVATPQGGYRMGNPAARVKLVEYGSITCPHCAHFAHESTALRQNYVRSGRVSWEYRPFLLFPTDAGLFMLLRCQGAAGFFPTSDRLYAEQASWAGKLSALPQETLQQLRTLEPKPRIAAIVSATGVDAYFRQRGMGPSRISACLNDDRNLQALVSITERANQEGVEGTPTFFINGKLAAGAGTWDALEPELKRAGG